MPAPKFGKAATHTTTTPPISEALFIYGFTKFSNLQKRKSEIRNLDITASDKLEKFFAGFGIAEGTREVGGGSHGVLFLQAAHLHTHVLRLYHHHHAHGVECALYALFYLRGEPLLQL